MNSAYLLVGAALSTERGHVDSHLPRPPRISHRPARRPPYEIAATVSEHYASLTVEYPFLATRRDSVNNGAGTPRIRTVQHARPTNSARRRNAPGAPASRGPQAPLEDAHPLLANPAPAPRCRCPTPQVTASRPLSSPAPPLRRSAGPPSPAPPAIYIHIKIYRYLHIYLYIYTYI